VNDLPSDDPLRDPAAQDAPAAHSSVTPAALPVGLMANAKTEKPSTAATFEKTELASSKADSSSPRSVFVNDGHKLKVPSLVGLPVREVIEQASAAGLAVQISGNGTVREQAPAPGTLVATGTQVVVRCAR
jgi:cell division protein FtsI (penicillin-binding protein 3)